MVKKKLRRSEKEHRDKLLRLWFFTLAGLMTLVIVLVVIVDRRLHPSNEALSAEVDYSKICFEGLCLGDEVSEEIAAHKVIDATYNYFWNNISIAVDDENRINRLGFYTTDPIDLPGSEQGANFENANITYRDYPLDNFADFAMYFGKTKITRFSKYHYLGYSDKDYRVDLMLMEGEIYNLELSKNSSDNKE